MNRTQKQINLTLILSLITAVILWYVMFVVKPANFWISMSVSILILVTAAYKAGYGIQQIKKIEIRDILIGVVSAIGLYIIFYFGNIISGFLFPFKDSQILSVYSNRTQGNLIWIGLLLLIIIGPGEEIFWRGFIQNNLTKKFGENKGYLFTTLLYTGVHITTGNFMLIIAALVCGLYWGWMYKKKCNLVPIIISHALWDLAIFVLFPVM